MRSGDLKKQKKVWGQWTSSPSHTPDLIYTSAFICIERKRVNIWKETYISMKRDLCISAPHLPHTRQISCIHGLSCVLIERGFEYEKRLIYLWKHPCYLFAGLMRHLFMYRSHYIWKETYISMKRDLYIYGNIPCYLFTGLMRHLFMYRSHCIYTQVSFHIYTGLT